MRGCLSYLVVEFMRQGLSPQEACTRTIERLLNLPHLPGQDSSDNGNTSASASDENSKKASMHEASLVVGVIAMDKFGNVCFNICCALLMFTVDV